MADRTCDQIIELAHIDSWTLGDRLARLDHSSYALKLGWIGHLVAIDEQPVPPLEAHEPPEEEAVIAPSADVIVDDRADGGRLEVAAIERTPAENQSLDERGVLAVPGLGRRREPLFPAIEDLSRHHTAKRAPQNDLAAAFLQLVPRPDVRDQLDQAVVEKRDTRLQ